MSDVHLIAAAIEKSVASGQRWDERWMELARFLASPLWSKDRSRQVSAVIVNPTHQAVVSFGVNGFPRGLDDSLDWRHARPEKYVWTEHAERNAIFNAARIGVSTEGCTMYLPWFPCSQCARAIIQSGIRRLVTIQPDGHDATWGEDMLIASDMLTEAAIQVEYMPGDPPTQK